MIPLYNPDRFGYENGMSVMDIEKTKPQSLQSIPWAGFSGPHSPGFSHMTLRVWIEVIRGKNG